jgi:chemotaxis protein MotB
MIKRISLGLLIIALSSSCVSKKIYNDLESKYADLKKENRSISDENADLLKAKSQLELDRDALNKELAKVKSEREKLQADYAALNKEKA